jgi:membrane-associated phospholipid phosphatase
VKHRAAVGPGAPGLDVPAAPLPARPRPEASQPVVDGTSASPTPGWWIAAAGASLLAFVLLLTVVVLTGGVIGVDTAVRAHIVSVRTPALTVAARLVTTLGSFPVVVAVAVLAAAVLRRRTRRLISSVVLLTAVVVTAALVYLCKIAVGRTRPGTDTLIGVPSLDYSFPSGHTTDGTLGYVLVALLLGATLRPPARRLLVVAAVLVAAAVGLTRIYLGYHWTTDVLAGWFLAGGVALTSSFAVQRFTGSALRDVPASDAGAPGSGRAGTTGPRRGGRSG